METKAVEIAGSYQLISKKQNKLEDTSFAGLLLSLFSGIQSSEPNFTIPGLLKDGINDGKIENPQQISGIKFADINSGIFAAQNYIKQSTTPVSGIDILDLLQNPGCENKVPVPDIKSTMTEWEITGQKLTPGSIASGNNFDTNSNDISINITEPGQKISGRTSNADSEILFVSALDHNVEQKDEADTKASANVTDMEVNLSKLLEEISKEAGGQNIISFSANELQEISEKYFLPVKQDFKVVQVPDGELLQPVNSIMTGGTAVVENGSTEYGINPSEDNGTSDILDSIVSLVNQKLKESGSENKLSRDDIKVLVQRISQSEILKMQQNPMKASYNASGAKFENKTNMDSVEVDNTVSVKANIDFGKNIPSSEVKLENKVNMESVEGDKTVFVKAETNLTKPQSAANSSFGDVKNLSSDNSTKDYSLLKMNNVVSFNSKNHNLGMKNNSNMQQESTLHSIKFDKNEKSMENTVKLTKSEPQFLQISKLSSRKDGKEPISNENTSLKTSKEESQPIKTDLNMEEVKGFHEAGNGEVRTLSSKNDVQKGENTAFISNPEDMVDVVAKRFKSLKFPDMTELKVKLKPEDLGEIVIKVVLEKGQINGNVLAEKKEVAMILQNQIETLKQDLKNNNINLNSISVNIGSQQESMDRGSSGAFSQNQRRHHNRQHEEFINENIFDEKFEGIDVIA